MCQFSLESNATRKARKGEKLYSIQNHAGAFTSDPTKRNYHRGSGDKLVCIRYNEVLTLTNLQFKEGIFDELNKHHPWMEKAGKDHKVSLTKEHRYYRRYGRANGDAFLFEDGMVIPSYLIASAIEMPARKKPVRKAHTKGMQRIAESLGEVEKIDASDNVTTIEPVVEYIK